MPFDTEPPISVIPDPNNPLGSVVRFDSNVHKLPDFIQRHTFRSPSSSRRVVFYTAKAENEKGMIIGGSGLKNDFPLPPSAIKKLNDAGYSYLCLALPNPVRDHEFFDHYLHIAEELLTHPEHPIIQDWLNSDKPKIFLGYSTSAQIFYHLMREQRSFDTLTNEFKGAVLCSPYVRPPGAESEYGLKTLVLRAMAAKFPDKVSIETALGASYHMLGLKKQAPPGLIETLREARKIVVPEDLTREQEIFTPTFFQMVELMRHGNTIKGDFSDRTSLLRNRGNFDILTITGRDDPYASAALNRKNSEQAGFAHYECPHAKHAVPYEDPNFSSVIVAGMDAMLRGTFDTFSAGLQNWDEEVRGTPSKFIGPPHSVIPFIS